jgi:SAM-dependent methyltransferase
VRLLRSATDGFRGKVITSLDCHLDVLAQRVGFQMQLEARLPPRPGATPHDLFPSVGDEFWLWLNTRGYRQNRDLHDLLPSLPPEYFQRSTNGGRTGDRALEAGFDVYRLFRRLIELHYKPLSECKAILDFGCGWGRVLRFFLKDIPGDVLWGVDMWDEQVAWARKTNPWPTFLCIDRMPPSELPSHYFDVVFAYSVFSHLAEDVHLAWLDEFARILVPGGIVILTTWGADHIEHLEHVKLGRCETFEATHDDLYRQAIHRDFDREMFKSDYKVGRFCHLSIDFPHNRGYGETLIPKAYVERQWPVSHTMIDYIEDRSVCEQNVIVTRMTPSR